MYKRHGPSALGAQPSDRESSEPAGTNKCCFSPDISVSRLLVCSSGSSYNSDSLGCIDKYNSYFWGSKALSHLFQYLYHWRYSLKLNLYLLQKIFPFLYYYISIRHCGIEEIPYKSLLRPGFKSWKIYLMISFMKVLAYNRFSKTVKHKVSKIGIKKKKSKWRWSIHRTSLQSIC